MLEETPIKYRAFISYSHSDSAIVDWLHKALETYRLPKRLVGQVSLKGEQIPERLYPIFRDRVELASAATLSGAVQSALAHSATLIVVCSPQAARSRWVNQEIIEFQRLGRSDQIYCVVVDGTPGSADENECFPPALRGEEIEPLAADLRKVGDGRRITRLKLIAGIVGIRLDDLVLRDHRRHTRQMMLISSGALSSTVIMGLLALTAFLSQQEAERSRNQAEELVGFMLGELREKLEPIGRLEVLDSVANKAMGYFASAYEGQMADGVLLKRSIALRQIGQVRLFQGKLSEALEAFSESLQVVQQVARRSPNDTGVQYELGQVQFWNGYVYWEQQEFQLAESHFTDYLQTAKQLIEVDDRNLVWRAEEGHAYTNLGSLFSRQQLHAKALENFQLAVSIFEGLAADEPQNTEYQTELANSYSWLAGELLEFGELTAAVEVFEQHIVILELLKADGRNKHIVAQLATGTLFIADLYMATADLDSAAEVIARGKGMYAELTELDPENMNWLRGQAMSHLLEARLFRLRDELDAAMPAIEQSSRLIIDVANKTEVASYQQHDVAIVNNEYADILLARNMFDDAEPIVRNTIGALSGGDDTYELAKAHLLMGLIEQQRDNTRTATQSWQTAIDLVAELRNSSKRPEHTALLAELFFHTGENERANVLVASLRESGYKNFRIELTDS